MERNARIVRASIIGIIANNILVVFKLLVGTAVNSAAIISDGLNNLSDALSSIVTIIGAKIAGRAPDKKHPYGYGRIEYVSSVIVAAIIIYTGIQSFMDGLDKVISGDATHYNTASIVVIIAAVVIKILLGRYTKKQGEAVHSEALIGSGTDATFDAIASATILVSAAMSFAFNISIDGWLGMGIAVLILKAGIDILKDSLNSIIGTRIDKEYAQQIKGTIAAFPQIDGVYDLILNQYGPEQTIGSVHVQVPDDMSAREIDQLSRKILQKVFTEYGIILTIGIYARNDSNDESRHILSALRKCIAEYPDILQMHGFFVDEETKHVSFDIIVDFASDADPADIRNKILDTMRAQFPAYTFGATLDEDFSD